MPANMRFRASLNVLEYGASTICLWIDIIENNSPQFIYISSMTCSTPSNGWLKNQFLWKKMKVILKNTGIDC